MQGQVQKNSVFKKRECFLIESFVYCKTANVQKKKKGGGI